jgi:predicted dehydrogenase
MNKHAINIGLAGIGSMGTVHYRNWAQIGHARVTALVGNSPTDRQRAREWQLPLYDSISDMCRHEDIGLVDICTPTFMHKQMALESLSCGKHTIVEKPIALSLSDARAMYDAAEENGVQLYVAQVVQFTKETAILRRIAGDRSYGRPLDACFERLSAYPDWSRNSWMTDKAKSGLLPFDLHIHDLDLIVGLFGIPLTMSYTSAGAQSREYREQYRFSYGYEGLTVCAEAAWFNAAIPFTARWRVYFEHGMLIYDSKGVQGYHADGTVTSFDTEDDIRIATGINLAPTGMFYHELSHFADCAAKGIPSPFVPRRQILGVLSVLEKMGF